MESESAIDPRRAKVRLRSKAAATRDALAASDRAEYSGAICARAIGVIESLDAERVHCYLNIRSEVATDALIRELLLRNIEVIVPSVTGEGLLEHLRYTSEVVLQPARYGIPEPSMRDLATIDSLDVVLVPLLAFDRNCHRLGYGKGFYDRFLSQLSTTVRRIGLGFAVQEVDTIPIEPHDESLSTIVTEREIIRCRN